ncbi:hypothetical protein EB796_016494 [Bugula neritina]|uniref:Uncharacterized protein n=1 Tax=Bugula neritina TaxID=10212 RepID=A0A7J7JHB3_BUGNE|nr:hypothetical protein EB796_016494 [Bugula neritina]
MPQRQPPYTHMSERQPPYTHMPQRQPPYTHMPQRQPPYTHMPQRQPPYTHMPERQPPYTHMPERQPPYTHMSERPPLYAHMPERQLPYRHMSERQIYHQEEQPVFISQQQTPQAQSDRRVNFYCPVANIYMSEQPTTQRYLSALEPTRPAPFSGIQPIVDTRHDNLQRRENYDNLYQMPPHQLYQPEALAEVNPQQRYTRRMLANMGTDLYHMQARPQLQTSAQVVDTLQTLPARQLYQQLPEQHPSVVQIPEPSFRPPTVNQPFGELQDSDSSEEQVPEDSQHY